MGKRGPKPYEPAPKERETVRRLAALGLPHTMIANAIQLTKPTLYKHFRAELDAGLQVAAEAIGGTLMTILRSGPPQQKLTAAIFMAKTRLGWSERQHVEHSGQLDVRLLPGWIQRVMQGDAPPAPDEDDGGEEPEEG